MFKGCLSEYSDVLLSDGGEMKQVFERVIALDQSQEILYSQIRRRYKSFINWSTKNMKVECFDHENITPEIMEKCRILHVNEAGKETRIEETWNCQVDMIKNKEAYLILGYLNDEFVSFVLFLYSKKYAYYGVSASKRDLFDKPISHGLMWKGICRAKELGCSFLEMGEFYYPNHDIEVTKKEIDIGVYKRGFGGENRIRFIIHNKIGVSV